MSEFDELNKLGEHREVVQAKNNVVFLVSLVIGLIVILGLGFIIWGYWKGLSLI